ncbi:MAG: hypothetical protein RIE73_11855 [Coleofasciculus sp. C1-SOL-03]
MAWVGTIPSPLDFCALSETIGKVSSRSLTVEALKRYERRDRTFLRKWLCCD